MLVQLRLEACRASQSHAVSTCLQAAVATAPGAGIVHTIIDPLRALFAVSEAFNTVRLRHGAPQTQHNTAPTVYQAHSVHAYRCRISQRASRLLVAQALGLSLFAVDAVERLALFLLAVTDLPWAVQVA